LSFQLREEVTMKTQNKDKLAKAYRDGKTIQAFYKSKNDWVDIQRPQFRSSVKYRVKPDSDNEQIRLYQCIFFVCLGFVAGALLGGL
jgi:uncharacterized protein YdgA (DUF945 family)